MARTLAFRIPKQVLKRPQALVTSDRAATLPLLFEICKVAGSSEQEQPSPNVFRVLETFKKPSTSLLDIPRNLETSPFEYFTTYNSGDGSYTTEPRLLVTRLLTGSWCELQQFYHIYSGLHKKDVTRRLAEGTVYHSKLENEEHERVDVEKELGQLQAVASAHSAEEIEYLGRNYEEALWSKKIVQHTISRGIVLAQTRHVRELMVHVFADLDKGTFVLNSAGLALGVLVSGIADVILIESKKEAKQASNCEKSSNKVDTITAETRELSLFMPLWDLNQLIPQYKKEFQGEANSLTLKVTDVKTRGLKNLPRVKLQLDSARVQCMYYTHFIHSMARDTNCTYASYLENAKRRKVKADEPIGEAHAAIILLENFESMVLDFLRLARGEALDFDVHDDYMKERYGDAESAQALNYNLSQFIPQTEFLALIEDIYGDSLARLGLDISPLFRSWRYPLTARYFMARAAQIFNIFESLGSSNVEVEYHHAKSGTVIGSKVYPYSEKELKQEFHHASSFWTGRRRPKPADVKFKCSNCEFSSRCPAVVKPSKESIGELIYHDLLA